MDRKNTALILAAIAAIVGWNAFLIKRDAALFDAAHAQACHQVRSFHPDCQATP